ncbi:alpha/beta fold hydrolase [Bacillus marinisedimentorum]|uniref:alpha/beta fold hydrolase n=1 Tax=Bacillus marinisedimentorum TaxID=1821260 RepID=UPI0007E097B0|nr:alpha/beta hydrolase [Bacillus marinisedimentorum]
MILTSGHYVEMHGSGTPVLFIHPPFMGKAVFKYQLELQKYCQVILYDLLGHGQSRMPAKQVTITSLADNVIDVLDELEIEKAVLCGYSSGGSIAMETELRHPDRVQGVILCGGFSEVSTSLLSMEFTCGIKMVKAGLMHVLAEILALSHRITEEDRHELYEYCLLADQNTVHQLYDTGKKYCCTDRLHELKAPLQLVYGARDVYIHSYMDIFMKKVPHADPIFINKAPHQIPTKHYREFNHIIRSFVEELNGPKTIH